ncbi:MAG: SMP-30/gluconolactonase/LRE family protein [Nocardioidaceae bacterium]
MVGPDGTPRVGHDGTPRVGRSGTPRLVMAGIAMGESPRWHDSRLWFSDWGTGQVIAVDDDGVDEVIASVPSFPLCIDFLPDGRLIVVASEGPRLLRRELDGSLVSYAELADIATRPWNDIVIDGRGNAYVNNVNFDFPGGDPVPGLIALATPDGQVRQVADGVMFPNGMSVMPDNATLIVAESYAARLTAFDIADDGSLSGQRVWADLGDGVPDGICLDAEGAVWYADVPHQRCVRVAEGGKVLQTVDVDRGCFACTLGGPTGQTLYVTANEWKGADHMSDGSRTGQVLAIEVTTPATGWP